MDARGLHIAVCCARRYPGPKSLFERSGIFLLWTDNHYAWTYGPTAILVVVVSLWRQVDFWCKKLVPWQELRNGNATSTRSILLDYVSPLQATSLWHALRLWHVSVIVTITGFALLKVITIISTGLMMVG